MYDKIITRVIKTPDEMRHIVSLPKQHWRCLDWLVKENFMSLEKHIEIAWYGLKFECKEHPKSSFSNALGFTIQESFAQYESWDNGFINDNNN